jgi:hypothetical protein
MTYIRQDNFSNYPCFLRECAGIISVLSPGSINFEINSFQVESAVQSAVAYMCAEFVIFFLISSSNILSPTVNNCLSKLSEQIFNNNMWYLQEKKGIICSSVYIVYQCFMSRSRMFNLYRDVNIASEGVQNLDTFLTLKAFGQGGIFIYRDTPAVTLVTCFGFFFSSEELSNHSPLTTHNR